MADGDGRDWSPFGGDPIPGNPDTLDRLATTMQNISTDVNTKNNQLIGIRDHVNGAIWTGPAADAFKPKLSDLPDKFTTVVTSFRDCSTAVATYSRALRGRQADVAAQLTIAAKALEQKGTASSQATSQAASQKQATDAAKTAGKPAPDFSAAHNYGADAGAADATYQKACQEKDAIVTLWHGDVKTAKESIDDAMNEGVKPESHHWWDSVVDVISHPWKLVKAISVIANALSGICAILAICTLWCPALSAAFETASLVTGLIGLAADTALAIGGKGSWTDVALDSVGVLTAGAGKVLTAGADGTRAAGTAGRTLDTAVDEAGKSDQLVDVAIKNGEDVDGPAFTKALDLEGKADGTLDRAANYEKEAGEFKDNPASFVGGKLKGMINPNKNMTDLGFKPTLELFRGTTGGKAAFGGGSIVAGLGGYNTVKADLPNLDYAKQTGGNVRMANPGFSFKEFRDGINPFHVGGYNAEDAGTEDGAYAVDHEHGHVTVSNGS